MDVLAHGVLAHGVLAHGVGGRTDLPVPFWLALYGAGAAVLFSFAALGVFWPTARLRGGAAGEPLPFRLQRVVDAPATRWVLRLATLAVAGTITVAAFAGAPGADDNPAPWWLYVTFWVGVVPVSLLFGPVWRIVNPLRTVHELIARASGSDPDRGLRELPRLLGYWPAVISLAVFAWLELVHPDRGEPRVVGLFLVGYAAVHLVAASIFGSAWFTYGDGFEVYSTLVGRLAPVGRRDDGRLVVRSPLNGLASITSAPGLVATVTILLGSTAFDGVTRTRFWKDRVIDLIGWEIVPFATAVLAGCVVVVVLTYVGATLLAGRPRTVSSRTVLPGVFVHSVVPIAVGYAVAHYFTLFLFEGQQSLILASDPFGRGANWFGTALWTPNFSLVTQRTVALVQVGAIVVGHVVGVVAAHDRAVGMFSGRAALRSQYPLVAVMVGYTLAGVTLLLGS